MRSLLSVALGFMVLLGAAGCGSEGSNAPTPSEMTVSDPRPPATSSTTAPGRVDVVPPEDPCFLNPITCVDDDSFLLDQQAEHYYEQMADYEFECYSPEMQDYREWLVYEAGLDLDEECPHGHAGVGR